MPEEEKKQKPITVRQFGCLPDSVFLGEEMTIYWYVENADSISFEPKLEGDFKHQHSTVIRPAKSYDLKLIAKAGDLQTEHKITIQVKPREVKILKAAPEPKDLIEGLTARKVPHPTLKGVHGFVLEGGVEVPDGDRPRVQDSPDKCPACSTVAKAWEPPVHESRFRERLERITQENQLDPTDNMVAYREYLKLAGGILVRCQKCGTGFFIPTASIKIAGE